MLRASRAEREPQCGESAGHAPAQCAESVTAGRVRKVEPSPHARQDDERTVQWKRRNRGDEYTQTERCVAQGAGALEPGRQRSERFAGQTGSGTLRRTSEDLIVPNGGRERERERDDDPDEKWYIRPERRRYPELAASVSLAYGCSRRTQYGDAARPRADVGPRSASSTAPSAASPPSTVAAP